MDGDHVSGLQVGSARPGGSARLVIALAAALVAVLVFQRACGGAGSLQEVTSRYLAAARAGDVRAMVALAPPDFEPEAAARAKVAAYAPVREGAVIRVEYNADANHQRNGIIHAHFSSGTFSDEVPLRVVWGRWYVLLGHPRSGAR